MKNDRLIIIVSLLAIAGIAYLVYSLSATAGQQQRDINGQIIDAQQQGYSSLRNFFGYSKEIGSGYKTSGDALHNQSSATMLKNTFGTVKFILKGF